MVQEVITTHKEKVEMYMLIEKERLVEMLIEANNTILRLTSSSVQVNVEPITETTISYSKK